MLLKKTSTIRVEWIGHLSEIFTVFFSLITDLLYDNYIPNDATMQEVILKKLSDYCGKNIYNYTTEDAEPPVKWDFYHSFFFSYTVVSTIGEFQWIINLAHIINFFSWRLRDRSPARSFRYCLGSGSWVGSLVLWDQGDECYVIFLLSFILFIIVAIWNHATSSINIHTFHKT